MRQLAIVFLATIVSATVVTGDTLFSNINQPANPVLNVLFPFDMFASEFVTGNEASTITELTCRVSSVLLHTTAHAFLYDNDADQPGALLGTFTPLDIDLPPGDTLITFTHPGIQLQPNQTCWIALSARGEAEELAWRTSSSGATDVGSVFGVSSTLGLKASGDNGSSWISLNLPPDENFLFSLNGTIVPEPSPIVLAMIAISALLLRWKLLSRRTRH